MADDEDVLGLTVDQQLAAIAAAGVGFVVAGLAMGSAVDPTYSPTVLLVRLVAVGDAVVRFAVERLP